MAGGPDLIQTAYGCCRRRGVEGAGIFRGPVRQHAEGLGSLVQRFLGFGLCGLQHQGLVDN